MLIRYLTDNGHIHQGLLVDEDQYYFYVKHKNDKIERIEKKDLKYKMIKESKEMYRKRLTAELIVTGVSISSESKTNR